MPPLLGCAVLRRLGILARRGTRDQVIAIAEKRDLTTPGGIAGSALLQEEIAAMSILPPLEYVMTGKRDNVGAALTAALRTMRRSRILPVITTVPYILGTAESG